MQYLAPIGRVLYSAVFLVYCVRHFTPGTVAFATAQGVPFAAILVPLSGVIGILGAASIALGYRAKQGAWLIVLFLVPVTIVMHRFWGVPDPMQAATQRAHFLKNLSLAGAALLICYFTSVAPDAWVLALRK